MALQRAVGPHSYVRPIQKWTNSRTDKKDPNQSDFNYTAVLNEEIQNVIGISITSYNLPRDTTPSFYPSTQLVTGRNMLDFSLENSDIQVGPEIFTVTWPTKFYTYSAPAAPDIDYNLTLERLMNEQIDANPTWEGKVKIRAYEHPLNSSLLIAAVTDPTLPDTSTTELKLLFGTGANASEAANLQMGFPVKADYASSQTTLYTRTGTQVIESPFPTQLNLFPYVDVFIKESSRSPTKRIYVEDSFFTLDNKSDSVNQTHINLDNPPRHLKELNISIRYPNRINPGTFDFQVAPHSFGFTFVQLADENAPVPTYVEQNMAW